MSIRYIGSKNRVVADILKVLGAPSMQDSRFIDAFCGTGAVGAAAAAVGWRVHLNDQLFAAVCLATARATSEQHVPFRALGGYANAVALLNGSRGREGFIWREYSPAAQGFTGFERRYFTEENAAGIDAMRFLIAEWAKRGVLTDLETRVLIADLLQATNRIANISGTYGCYLRSWTAQALLPISVRPRRFLSGTIPTTFTVDNATQLTMEPSDVCYIDPPYTKRQYASYYHVLETIAHGDSPVVSGVTGLRPWRDKASDFCHKRRALRAFRALLTRVRARRVLVSYSSEGHVQLPELAELLTQFGKLTVHELGSVGRYRPNAKASRAASAVTEYVLALEQEPVPCAEFAHA